jgi:hypothetical protein
MEHLAAIWATPLIKDRVVTPESLAQFTDTLNAAQPARHTAGALVSDLVSDLMNDPENLYSVILNAPRNAQYIILYTNALYITRYFKLMYLVHLRQSRDGKYHATPYQPASKTKFNAQAWQQGLGFGRQKPDAPRLQKPEERPARRLSKHAPEFIPLRILKRGHVLVDDGGDAMF